MGTWRGGGGGGGGGGGSGLHFPAIRNGRMTDMAKNRVVAFLRLIDGMLGECSSVTDGFIEYDPEAGMSTALVQQIAN